jgi:hypothetical protein
VRGNLILTRIRPIKGGPATCIQSSGPKPLPPSTKKDTPALPLNIRSNGTHHCITLRAEDVLHIEIEKEDGTYLTLTLGKPESLVKDSRHAVN